MGAKLENASGMLIPPGEVFSRIKKDLVAAMPPPAPFSEQLLERWRSSLVDLGLPSDIMEQLHGESLDHLQHCLTTVDFQSFRESVFTFGHDMARHKVKFHHVIAALDSVLESCLPGAGAGTGARRRNRDTEVSDQPGTGQQEGLRTSTQLRHGLAVARLCLLMIRISASGYAQQWEAEWHGMTTRMEEGNKRARRTSTQLTKMYERERRRVSRVLHDQLGHDLIVLKLYLEDIAKDIERSRRSKLSDELKDSLKVVAHALKSMRRLVVELGPPILEEIGLVAAMRLYARQYSAQTWMNITLETGDLPDPIPLARSVVLYRAFQEALSLARRGRARNVKIVLGQADGPLAMLIEDDTTALDLSSTTVEHSLTLLRVHVEALGGVVYIETPIREGGGTKMEVLIPASVPETKAG